MNKRHAGLLIVLLSCLGLYLALGAPRLLKAWVSTNEQEIACRRASQWLDEHVSRSKKTESREPAELVVLRRHCWSQKQ